MTEKLTVLVDMDGVLADFNTEVQSRLSERHPNIPLVDLDVMQNFYIADEYPEHKDLVREITNEPGFFKDLPLVENALEGWQRMIDLGYEPRICSSPLSKNPTCEVDKLSWLHKKLVPVFGKFVVEQAIITKDKHLQQGIALIDDRPQVRFSDEAKWKYIVFDRPYNRHINDLRIKGWDDEDLPEILESAVKKYKT